MVLGTFTQQPADRLDYDVDCTELLTDNDTILSASVATTPVGLTVSSVVVGTKVKLWVSGGVDGNTYKTEVTVTTTLGRIKQDEIKFKVKEI